MVASAPGGLPFTDRLLERGADYKVSASDTDWKVLRGGRLSCKLFALTSFSPPRFLLLGCGRRGGETHVPLRSVSLAPAEGPGCRAFSAYTFPAERVFSLVSKVNCERDRRPGAGDGGGPRGY